MRGYGAVSWQAAVIAAFGVMLEHGLERQPGVLGEVDAQRRHDGVALLFNAIDLVVGILRDADQTIGDALVIQRAGEVERGLLVILAAVGQPDLPTRLVLRLLAGHRHQATGQAAAIEHRGWAFEDVDTLDEIGIDLQAAVGAAIAQQLLAIEVEVIHRPVSDTAHGDVVVTGSGTIGSAHQARRIAYGLGNGA